MKHAAALALLLLVANVRDSDACAFVLSADQADVKQPPHIIKVPREVEIPVDLIIIGVVIVFFVVRAARKARRATT